MTQTEITSRQLPSVHQAGSNPLLRTLAKAARSVETNGETCYIFATHGGWKISSDVPSTGSFYRFESAARFLVER